MGRIVIRRVALMSTTVWVILAMTVACGPTPSPTALPVTQRPVGPVATQQTPTEQAPTQTPPTSTPSPSPTSLPPTPVAGTPATEGHLALGMRIYDTEFAPSFAQSGDILGTGYKRGVDPAEKLLSSVPKENRMLMFATTEGLAEVLDSLTIEISYIGYDLERGPATSTAEQQDPVAAVKRAQEIAHSRGLQLVVGPSRYFNEKYGTQLAPYVDVYMPQAKFYQANLSGEQYAQTVGQLIQSLRQANPEMRVFLDISPSPKNVEETPEAMLQSVDSVRDLIDGVWITYNPGETQQVGQFVGLMGR